MTGGDGRAGPPSPQEVATAWVEAVMDEADLAVAWPLTEPVLRLVLAQDWIWTNRHLPDVGSDQDWDSIARDLASCPPAHRLWDAFAPRVLARWHESWPGFSTLTWQAWDEPEIDGLDTEVVSFFRRDAGSPPGPVRREGGVHRFTMRHGEAGWLVARVSGGQLFAPGWPPSPEV